MPYTTRWWSLYVALLLVGGCDSSQRGLATQYVSAPAVESPATARPDLGSDTRAGDIPGVSTSPSQPLGCQTDEHCTHAAGPCQIASCNISASVCELEPVADGPCDDNNPCTTGDVCTDTGCQGEPTLCDDGEPCTEDLCDPTLGDCTHPSQNGDCDDGDPCTMNDACSDGLCTGQSMDGCHYVVPPDVGSCAPGTLSPLRKAQALERVNTLRMHSGLPPVSYDFAGDAAAQEAALMMVANSDIEHQPPQSWACWTPDGYDAAESGNLYILWGWDDIEPDEPSAVVDGWVIDEGVPSLGHRRWILDPFLKKVSYGSVHGPALVPTQWEYSQSSVLIVIHDEVADISNMDLPFVAYPVGDYPAEAFDTSWYHSFSVIVNPKNAWSNQGVDYSDAIISVVGPSGPHTVHSVYASNDWFGLPNHLQWIADGLKSNTTYSVHIDQVRVEGTMESYQYEFTLK